MTDVLAERFAALAARTDDSDWRDVRRRARTRRRFVAPTVAVLATVVAVAAVAAGSGWIFTSHANGVSAVTHVALAGRTWTVTLTRRKVDGVSSLVCVAATSGKPAPHASRCRIASTRLGTPFTAATTYVPGGQIWAGTTLGFTQRVSITNYAGRVYTTTTIAAPKGTKTPFRYWAVAVAGSPAASLTTYDANGKSIVWRLR